MAIEIKFEKFNEKDPWGRHSTHVNQENITFAQRRWEAFRAYQAGKATAEQMAILNDTDEVLEKVLPNVEFNKTQS